MNPIAKWTQVLIAVEQEYLRTGLRLTVRDVVREQDIYGSTSVVDYVINKLVDSGYLERIPKLYRTIKPTFKPKIFCGDCGEVFIQTDTCPYCDSKNLSINLSRSLEEQVSAMIDVHRKIVKISCPPDCFCWELDALLTTKEKQRG